MNGSGRGVLLFESEGRWRTEVGLLSQKLYLDQSNLDDDDDDHRDACYKEDEIVIVNH